MNEKLSKEITQKVESFMERIIVPLVDSCNASKLNDEMINLSHDIGVNHTRGNITIGDRDHLIKKLNLYNQELRLNCICAKI